MVLLGMSSPKQPGAAALRHTLTYLPYCYVIMVSKDTSDIAEFRCGRKQERPYCIGARVVWFFFCGRRLCGRRAGARRCRPYSRRLKQCEYNEQAGGRT